MPREHREAVAIRRRPVGISLAALEVRSPFSRASLVSYGECVGREGPSSVSTRPRYLRPTPKKELEIAPMSFGGERFIAQQLRPGSWSILDRRHREFVGSEDKSHQRSEQRAAALNAANARL